MAQLKVRMNQAQRQSHHQRDAFRSGQAHGFGNEFAEHDMQQREKRERQSQRGAVYQQVSARALGGRRQRGFDGARDGDFADGAKAQAGERDAELDTGENAVEVAEQFEHGPRSNGAARNKLADPREPHRHQRIRQPRKSR